MDERDELARLRVEELRDEFGILNDERRMAREAQDMQRKMKDFEEAEGRTEREIEEELRKENWGKEPERPPQWPGSRSGA